MKIIKLTFTLLSLSIAFWIFYCVLTLPSLNGIGNKTRVPSISVLDNKEFIIGSLGDVYGGFVDMEEVPKHLIDAIIVLEDKRFYSHFGLDFRGLLRAAVKNLKEMRNK